MSKKFSLMIIIAGLALGALPFAVSAQEGSNSDKNLPASELTVAMTVTSSINDQEYLIYVGLPWDYYEIDEPMPVIYVLDPQFAFGSVTEITRVAHWGDELPATIVVGIGYPALLELATDNYGTAVASINRLRGRDYVYSVGQEEFLAFITDELIPRIDSTYNTDPEERAIYGYSYGGTFVLYALYHANGTFNRYIAISPSSSCPTCKLENPTERSIHVAVAGGGGDAVYAELDELGYEWLHIALLIVDNGTHRTMNQALTPALKYVYCRDTIFCSNPID